LTRVENSRRKCLIILLLFLFSSTRLLLFSQKASSSLRGKVTDEEGAPLPGVSVEARNISSGQTWTAVTDELGQFAFKNIELGRYKLTCTLPGFKPFLYDTEITPAASAFVTVIMPTGIDERGGTKIYPTYPKATLNRDLPWNPLPAVNFQAKEILRFKDGLFYSPTGIAKIGLTIKQLENIIEIPINDNFYKKDGLSVENNCVYALKADYSDHPVIILLKVESLSKNSVRFQFYVSKIP